MKVMSVHFRIFKLVRYKISSLLTHHVNSSKSLYNHLLHTIFYTSVFSVQDRDLHIFLLENCEFVSCPKG
ncbi:hypothetical protein Nmel_006884 [Mimus melanotis]